LNAASGDKIRIKRGPHAGERALVIGVDGDALLVKMESGTLRLRQADVINYSLAARKAWKTGPDRAVGRRKGSKVKDRISVTFRIDRELWERYLRLEKLRQVEDRNDFINEWLEAKVDEALNAQESNG
jgi:hypothetical protein